MNRKTAHSYAKQFSGNYGQVREVIIIEASWLGYHEPYEQKEVHTFIAEMMTKNNQQDLVKEYNLEPITVNVLEPKRTFCEKIMSLVRFSYAADPVTVLKSKIRHAYDLHQMLRTKEITGFFNSPGFTEMLKKVGQDDWMSYKNENAWLREHPKDAFFFRELTKVWQDLKPTYKNDFKNLVYGPLPDPQEVLASLNLISDRLKNITWSISQE